MNSGTKGSRALKRSVLEILKLSNMDEVLDALKGLPERRVINPLFSFLFYTDEKIKWRAVTAMGSVTEELAKKDLESARVIVRRLMWNLNDESGGIGWGSPEAMGEILARNERLANEYSTILISYAEKEGNFLELEMLQRGLLWGIGRLAEVRPHFPANRIQCLIPFLESKDVIIKGSAARVMSMVCVEEARSSLERLLTDGSEFQLFVNQKMTGFQIKDLAENALEIIGN